GGMTTLTQCQQQVLDMLISYQKERGFPPTNQEVATMLGYRSVNAAVTDTEAQHSAAVEAAEAQRQSLIDAAMASISLIQLKLQAGRKLTQPENTRLNAVLDYID
ncbi:tail fiber assembly protein, partial [Escherichia coli]